MAEHRKCWRDRVGEVCLLAGAWLLAAWFVPSVYGMLFERMELSRFQSTHEETISWAPGRVAAYRKALHDVAVPPPVAVLRIPSANLQVPVLEGTSQVILNRGAGHLSGTAEPGGSGNIVIAGHRDGFFRRLKSVSVGDHIEVARAGGTDVYRVDQLQIVERTETAALQPSRKSLLTLVTCYPFFYLGAAPQRYVVRASLLDHHAESTLQ